MTPCNKICPPKRLAYLSKLFAVDRASGTLLECTSPNVVREILRIMASGMWALAMAAYYGHQAITIIWYGSLFQEEKINTDLPG